jgi:asparagine synthase (glutamine-hydrolysing)
MCGILGFVGKDKALGEQMAKVLAHRGPDDEGIEADESVVIGSRRLSIQDLSRRAHMPMWSDDHRIAIIQNGEIYNFRELRRDLEKKGITFKSDGDTEVILRGFIAEGEEFFNKLRGMFAFALYDRKEGKIVLVRDPFGIKPLYYTVAGGLFAFASEMKALGVYLDSQKLQLHLSPLGCASYFTFGYAIAPHTIFEEVKKLSPGTILTYTLSGSTMRESKIVWEEEPMATFEGALRKSVERHLIADVPVGVYLSGGMDSTAIALMLKELGAPLHAFTLRIEERVDADYAKKIAHFAGLEHHEVVLTPEAFAHAAKELWKYVDEPVADSALFTSYIVSEEAKKKVKVVLTGEGGDEMFFGYERYKTLHSLSRISPKVGFFEMVSPTVVRRELASPYARAFLRRARILEARLRGDLLEAYAETAGIAGDMSDRLRIIKYLRTQFAGNGYMMSACDQKLYLPNDLLYKTDIATMAHSLEARVPFLDNAVASYARSLPTEQKFKDGKGKLPILQYLESRLPPELLMRKKEGFSVPLRHYLYKDHFAEVRAACGELAAKRIPGISNYVLSRIARDEAYAQRIAKMYPSLPFACLMFYNVLSQYNVAY